MLRNKLKTKSSQSKKAPLKKTRARICKRKTPQRITKRFNTTDANTGITNPTGLIRTTLSDGKFYNKQASMVLDTIVQRIEEPDIDYEFDNEVLYTSDVLKFKTPRGTWVLNKHNVTKQIWLSSPMSGPSKYNYHPPNFVWERDFTKTYQDGEGLGGVWLSERDDSTQLSTLLQKEWSEVFGMDIRFQQNF